MTWRCEIRDAHIPNGQWVSFWLLRDTVASAKRDATEHQRFIAIADLRGRVQYRIVTNAGAVVAVSVPSGAWRLRWRWVTEGAR